MRSHVFPVSNNKFQKLDGIEIDESAPFYSAQYSNYRGVGSDGGVYVVSTLTSSSEVGSINFIVEGGGEYLLDSNVSVPSETNLDWSGGHDSIIALNIWTSYILSTNPIVSGSASLSTFLEASELPDPEKLTAGEIFCIGSKNPADNVLKRNLVPAVYGNEGAGVFYPEEGSFGSGAFSIDLHQPNDGYVVDKSCWTTLMWNGTNFVLLGSNNWIS
jgi:hypothetical protein